MHDDVMRCEPANIIGDAVENLSVYRQQHQAAAVRPAQLTGGGDHVEC